jgi:hypothetical protein
LRLISSTFTISLRPHTTENCSFASDASTCRWHHRAPVDSKWTSTFIPDNRLERSARVQCFCTAPYTNVSHLLGHSPCKVFWPSKRNNSHGETLVQVQMQEHSITAYL